MSNKHEQLTWHRASDSKPSTGAPVLAIESGDWYVIRAKWTGHAWMNDAGHAIEVSWWCNMPVGPEHLGDSSW